MEGKLARTIAVALTLFAAPGVAHAQGAPGPRSELPPQAQQLIMQLQQLQSQIDPIQRRALADPALQAEQSAIGAAIETAMAASDPSIPQQIERLQSLLAQAQSGTVQGDDRIEALVAEVRQIEGQLRAAQSEAIQRPEIATRIETFEARLVAKMTEVNPDVAGLLERMEELEAQLSAVMSTPG